MSRLAISRHSVTTGRRARQFAQPIAKDGQLIPLFIDPSNAGGLPATDLVDYIARALNCSQPVPHAVPEGMHNANVRYIGPEPLVQSAARVVGFVAFWRAVAREEQAAITSPLASTTTAGRHLSAQGCESWWRRVVVGFVLPRSSLTRYRELGYDDTEFRRPDHGLEQQVPLVESAKPVDRLEPSTTYRHRP